MRLIQTSTIVVVLMTGVCTAVDRQWQKGTWVDVGTKRTPAAGATSENRPVGRYSGKPVMHEVGTYVIETDDLRLELEDLVPMGSHGSFDLQVTIGPATFALNKKTAYIRKADGSEYRLLVTKKAPRRKA